MPYAGPTRNKFGRLIVYKLTHHTVQALKLLYRFFRYMLARDVLYLLIKPFLGQKQGATKAEVLSRAVEHAELKSDAADLTQLADDALDHAIRESRAERARIQAAAEADRRAA